LPEHLKFQLIKTSLKFLGKNLQAKFCQKINTSRPKSFDRGIITTGSVQPPIY